MQATRKSGIAEVWSALRACAGSSSAEGTLAVAADDRMPRSGCLRRAVLACIPFVLVLSPAICGVCILAFVDLRHIGEVLVFLSIGIALFWSYISTI